MSRIIKDKAPQILKILFKNSVQARVEEEIADFSTGDKYQLVLYISFQSFSLYIVDLIH